jgi:hypothetical protein
MPIRLLLAAAAVLTLAACGESSTAPQLSPTKATKDITCRSGYHIATRDDGEQTCESDGFQMAAAADSTF